MLVRPMTPNDLIHVLAIEQAVQYHPWTLKQFEEAMNSYQVTVLEDGQQVLGFCILQPVLDEANLLLMAISPQQQGKGLGYQLLTASLDALKNSPIQIFLEVRESNVAAIKLYEKADFHQIDVRKNYYPLPNGVKENAIIMVKACTDDFAALFK